MVRWNEAQRVARQSTLALTVAASAMLLAPAMVSANEAATFQPADELYDNFDEGQWKECLWNPYQRRGGQIEYFDWTGAEDEKIRVSNGKLEMEVLANEAPGQSWELGLESKFFLAGDFEAQVDYEISHSNYWANLDMRGINMLFVELMAGDQGTRRRHVRRLDMGVEDGQGTTTAHLWLSNPDHDRVTQIDTDNKQRLREIPVGRRPARTAVDLLGNVYVHNRGNMNSDSGTSVTFIKASACPDPDCDLSQETDHRYTLDFGGGQFGDPIYNGVIGGNWGGGVAVDRNNDPWIAFREPGKVYHMNYHPSETPGGDTWTVNTIYDLRAHFGGTVRIYGMAFARDGNLWVATRGSSPERLIRINPQTGTFTDFSPPVSELTNGCISTYGLAIDAEQRLFWATFAGGDCRGLRFDPSLSGDAAWTALQVRPQDGAQADQQNARGMAADSQGRIWLAGDSRSKLVAFDSDTAQSVFVDNTCQNPAGVALDRNNLLWVSCRGASFDDQVRYYNSEGQWLGSVGALSTYTYSDMTGYQLRNFGLEDWEESFLVGQDEIVGTYYVSSVENNYGGGIEYGTGADAIVDPTQAPFEIHPEMAANPNAPQARRMRIGQRYYTDQVPRIAEHPVRLEGVWGFRTPATEALDEIPFRFTVQQDSYVYVAFETMANPVPDWLRGVQGWQQQSDLVQTTDPNRNYRLYRKWFDAGEEVILGNANDYAATPPAGAPFLNYFVYVYPQVLDGQPPENPQAFIDEQSGATANSGTLRIAREGSVWTYSYRDGSSGVWRIMENPTGPIGNVPVRLRTRLDPFWHNGPQSQIGGSLYFRFDNFAVNHADAVPGSPYCREGCDETIPGYGTACLGGTYSECPGVFECVDDQLTCVVQPRAERCNGLDDDCDGWVDHNADGTDFGAQFVSHNGQTHLVEDFGMPGVDPASGAEVTEGAFCSTGMLGPCAQGYWECVGGAMQCQPFQSPQPEQCDGEDNSCDGNINEDSMDPLSRLDRYVLANQRSMPNTPIRPQVPNNGQNFQTWAGFDGQNVNPQREGVIKEKRARVVLFLDPTLPGPGGHPELGRFVLWLAHGEAVPTQGAVTASYSMTWGHQDQVPGLIMQDGIVKSQIISNPARMQRVTVQSGEFQSGGAALGPLASTANWSVLLSAHFTGDITGWDLYNALTGEVIEMTPNEILRLSNNPLSGLDGLYGALTAEVGMPCDTGQEGICGRGAARCIESGGEWGITCLPSVVPQLEVCDGRDNSCTGEIDSNPTYGFAVPVVQYQQVSGQGEGQVDPNAWQSVETTDTHTSAVDFLNFRERGGSYGPGVGSPDVRDVLDSSRSMQAVDRSLWTVHRDLRQGNGTLALVMAHGKYVEAPGDSVPSHRASVSVTMRHQEARESFLTWFDDQQSQSDGATTTAADTFMAQNPDQGGDGGGTPYYNMNWTLHRWVENGNARREADSGVIMDLFSERTDLSDNLALMTFSSQQISDWVYYRPNPNGDDMISLNTGRRVVFRVLPATPNGYNGTPLPECTIIENDMPECIGQQDFYTCSDGQLQCGIGTSGCCSEDHPRYNEPCGLDDEDYINRGACYSAWRCGDTGGWQCQQIVSPQVETCDGQDNTCDGIVDGFVSPFRGDDGTVLDECPDGQSTCGPQECRYRSICGCAQRYFEETGEYCICIDSLDEVLQSPYERLCDWHERLEEGECVPVASVGNGF